MTFAVFALGPLNFDSARALWISETVESVRQCVFGVHCCEYQRTMLPAH
jgi:hypothetical protein